MRRLHVCPGPRVLVAQEAGVGGQGVVGENRVIVGRAGAGRVLAGWRVLLEGRGQVQVLRGERKQIDEMLVKLAAKGSGGRMWHQTIKC